MNIIIGLNLLVSSFSENKILSNLNDELLFRIRIPLLFENFYYKNINDEDKIMSINLWNL